MKEYLKNIAKNYYGDFLRFKKRPLIKERINQKNLMLDICGGVRPYGNGFLNVDSFRHPSVDIVVKDIRKKLPFPDNSAKKIISIATLEHFSLKELPDILNEFYRIMMPGATLEIGVPSLPKIYAAYQSGDYRHKVINRYLVGIPERNKYDVHKVVLDFNILRNFLDEAGFIDIREEEYDYLQHDKNLMMKVACRKQEPNI